ncbi:MAG: ABC transporter permease [Planctomycetes bacterium]|nr:ABC transporter permease [Planctomycetota bacterium]
MSDAAIEVRGLTLAMGGRVLLDGADLLIRPGECVLLAGPSGSGKTVFLKTLAGILRSGEEGGCMIRGRIRVAGRAGIVFQDAALLAGLTVEGNLRFALDHRPDGARDAARIPSLIAEFGLPARARVHHLSGGQRGRTAVARTLAFDPPVILYDEPTSGLDPALRDRVARTIREVHGSHGKTTLVASHDLASLLPIADRVIVLDPSSRRLREVGREDAEAVLREVEEATSPEATVREVRAPSPFARAGRALVESAARIGDAAVAALFVLGALIPHPPRIRWGVRHLGYYLRLVAGPSAIVYLGSSGLLIGFIATFFTFRFLPFRQYTEPLLIDDLVAALGYAMYRILVPLIGSILLAARSGGAVAADIGNRSFAGELDAMRSLGVEPRRYLLAGVVQSFVVGAPLLIGIAFVLAREAGFVVFGFTHPGEEPLYWHWHFGLLLADPGSALWKGTGWLLAKLLIGALGIAGISYFLGARPKRSGREVSDAVTAAVIWGTVFVLLVHFLFSFFEFQDVPR